MTMEELVKVELTSPRSLGCPCTHHSSIRLGSDVDFECRVPNSEAGLHTSFSFHHYDLYHHLL